MGEKKVVGAEPVTIGVTIAGDVPLEHFLYEHPAESGVSREVWEWREPGGAERLTRLLQSYLSRVVGGADGGAVDSNGGSGARPAVRVTVGVGAARDPRTDGAPHAYFRLQPCSVDGSSNSSGHDGRSKAWRVRERLGVGRSATSKESLVTFGEPRRWTLEAVAGLPSSRIVVLSDENEEFRDAARSACWCLPAASQPSPDWIVLHARRPFGQGDLWLELTGRLSDRLVVIVDADDLRRSYVSLSRGISWELTAEDFFAGLRDNGELRELRRCRHLIVVCGCDGALWIDQSDRQHPAVTLVCDPGRGEGEWSESLTGGGHDETLCVLASVVGALVEARDAARPLDLRDALAVGLAATRDLLEQGHGPANSLAPSGWPIERVVEALAGGERGDFATWPVPWPTSRNNTLLVEHPWRFTQMSQLPQPSGGRPSLLGLSRLVVTLGPQVLKRLPHARFGGLLTVDRGEIETLRSVRRLFREFRDEVNPARPLAVGAFGPPGSGRTFGLREVACEVFGRDAWLEFNLSQFHDTHDLNGAFHQVREAVLAGAMPVVCWDEYDSQDYVWLPSLLGPLQDGRFQEGLWHHVLGKCVFVFSAGTCHSSEEFGPPESDREAFRRFQIHRGPEFQSRLNAQYDVLGVNQRTKSPTDKSTSNSERVLDHDDVEFPLRRALLIRALLGYEPDARVDFDPDLLEALLKTPKYKHGVRSLVELIGALRKAPGEPIRRASLPSPHQLALHVDTGSFAQTLERSRVFRPSDVVPTLAPVLHTERLEEARRESRKLPARLDLPFERLDTATQDEYAHAACRIPEVLAAAGLAVLVASPTEPVAEQDAIAQHLEQHLDRLTELAHDAWVADRVRRGWTYGAEFDDARRIDSRCRPYARLPWADRRRARDKLRRYPALCRAAGYRLEFPGQGFGQASH